MKYILIAYFTVFAGVHFAQAQFNFKQHKVELGEDVYSIAKLYGTTPEAIYDLNPMAKEGIQPDTFIVLPNVILPPEKVVKGINFKKHRTRKKETLYSIARKYGVNVGDIKKHNEFLETAPLRKGDIVLVPLPAPKVNKVVRKIGRKRKAKVQAAVVETKIVEKVLDNKYATQTYTVLPKDTRYGIARKFGITIPELENMNPNLDEDFPIGIQILVPAKILEATKQPDSKFKLYEVPPKQTLYSLGKKHKISIDSINALNPQIKEIGLKAGMILRLPDMGDTSASLVDLETKMTNFSKKSIAVLLPFGIKEIDFDDSEQIKSHLSKSRVVRLTVDFYSGVLMAVEAAKKIGISTVLNVYDTQKSGKVVKDLVVKKDLKSEHAIIGPLLPKNAEKVASLLKDSKVPVFSPISNKGGSQITNLFQTVPTPTILQDRIIAYVKSDSVADKKVIIIADTKHGATKAKLVAAFPNAKVLNPEEKNYLSESELIKIIGKEESKIPTWVFLESSEVSLLSNVIPMLNAKTKTHNITLVTTNKSSAYDNESIMNAHLSKLKFHYPSVNKEMIKSSSDNAFYKEYEKKYGLTPNHYAVRGYDLTYDLLLRLSASNNFYQLSKEQFTSEYLENKFSYKENSLGGYTNTACYIIRYADGLEFKVVN